MNVSSRMKKWAGKAAAALALFAVLGGAASARGQVIGDICAIDVISPPAGSTVSAPGTKIKFTIRLGKFNIPVKQVFQKVYIGPAGFEPPAGMADLAIKMSTGGWAYLDEIKAVPGDIGKYDCIFIYTVQEGDFALPLTIAGTTGAAAPGEAFTFKNDDLWEIQETKVASPSRSVVWRLGDEYIPSQGDNSNWTMAESAILVQTLDYDEAGDYSVAATDTRVCRIMRPGAASDLSHPVSFYLWSGNTNSFTIDGADPSGVKALSIPTGKKSVEFVIRGVTAHTDDFLYLGATAGPPPDGTTNWTAKAVHVTDAPEPTVKVILDGANVANVLTVTESDAADRSLKVTVTHPPATNIWVGLSADTNLIGLAADGVTILKGQTESDPVSFAARNDTPGVGILPVCSDPFYKLFRKGTVIIENRSPVILEPTTTLKKATTLSDEEFNFIVDDVSGDGPSMRTTWKWGDGMPDTVTTGLTGTASHKYVKAGTYPVTVRASDGDGGASETTFSVEVTDPAPKPYIYVTAVKDHLSENDTNVEVRVALSESYPLGNVGFKLNIVYPDPAVTNIKTYIPDSVPLEIAQGETAYNKGATLPFQVLDGTVLSQYQGIEIYAVPTDPAISNIYVSRPARVYIDNASPKVELPEQLSYTEPFPATVERNFRYKFTDVDADQGSIVSVWDFDDGTPAVTNIGHAGTIKHTYMSEGSYKLTISVRDKDDQKEISYFRPVAVGTVPTISVLDETQTRDEDTKTPFKVTVVLSTPYPEAVPVTLAVTPACNDDNGRLHLSKQNIVFEAGRTMMDVYFDLDLDGTKLSAQNGFRITPSITTGTANYAAKAAFFRQYIPATVLLLNVPPAIQMPKNAADAKDIAFQVSQNIEKSYGWNVKDCEADRDTMKVRWDWGDGSHSDGFGAIGSVLHTYNSFGLYAVTMTATDKDGEVDQVTFNVQVNAAKTLFATPVGPNANSMYFGLSYLGTPLGSGKITSIKAVRSTYVNDVYQFVYEAMESAADLHALPDPSGEPGVSNNFFYAWDDLGAGLLQPDLLNPRKRLADCVFPMADSDTGGVYQVRAVFSRSWRPLDNKGDVNQDGIPDEYKWLREAIMAVAGGDPDADVSLYAMTDLKKTNPDGDVWPVGDPGKKGKISITDAKCLPFTTIEELRGKDPGLNDPVVGRGADGDEATDGPLDEPGAAFGTKTEGTNPTVPDTDSDGLDDGYEYCFWRYAKIDDGHGERYNPADPGSPIDILPLEIAANFNPLSDTWNGGRDTDQDGLPDLAEYLLGTNPIHWDTDRDGIPDGWEVTMGTDPFDDSDASEERGNPDGDWMAYVAVPHQLVTVTLAGTDTQYLVGPRTEEEEAGFTAPAVGDGYGDVTALAFYTLYRYGAGDDAPLARGREVDLLEVFGTAMDGTVSAVEPADALLLHFQVYQYYGFDPRVAWGDANDVKGNAGPSGHTRAFTTKDEFYLCKFMSNVVRGGAPITPDDWKDTTTCPLTPDTDAGDGMPDGWELYVACGPDGNEMTISPWDPKDGRGDDDGDHLENQREFGGLLSSAHYADESLYTGSPNSNAVGQVTIVRPEIDAKWLNKFWPSDPWDEDTDGDGLTDYNEQATMLTAVYPNGPARAVSWQYGEPVADKVNSCFRGAGLNPCSMDTDWDGLPDPWEYAYTGTNAVTASGAAYIESGMDGTYGPGNAVGLAYVIGCGDAYSWPDTLVTGGTRREMDFDNDGLENYQEYMIQAMRHFRYDKTTNEVPMDGSFDISAFFTPIEKEWDVSRTAFWPEALNDPAQTWVMLPLGATPDTYVTTDPRNPDTDGDGLDDYYEMFHGLNPILGEKDLISEATGGMITYKVNAWGGTADDPLPMDFVKYPWMAGLGSADPDGDGLLNAEERIQANAAPPPNHNTDPSPLWMTDCYYTNSLVNRFYRPQSMFFWDINPVGNDEHYAGYFLYSFEMNEGYDTDNDGISDKSEALRRATSRSDPQDPDDPLRRQALWFPGTNAAAETLMSYAYDEWTFRTFTLEMWACPEDVSRDQVLMERPVFYEPSDLSATGMSIRLNFRVGILADGRIYAKYQNAGVHDEESGEAVAYGPRLKAGEWVHVAVRADGAAKELTLLLNGTPYQTVPTALIPANGVFRHKQIPVAEGGPADFITDVVRRPAMIILGAANRRPDLAEFGGAAALWNEYQKFYEGKTISPTRPLASWSAYDRFYKGYLDEVRIWDGARGNLEILEDYAKRYRKPELERNRDAVAAAREKGATRIEGDPLPLPPELLHHYSFDNLFGADATNSVATAPRGFNAPSVAANRPAGYEVAWWAAWKTKSDVYNDYGVVPWIENGVGHLADPYGTTPSSRFWGRIYSGIEPLEGDWQFPLTGNPYGMWYRNDRGDGLSFLNAHKGPDGWTNAIVTVDEISPAKAGEWLLNTVGDLLPLGGAWAKQAVHMWDSDAASGVWAETGEDTDSDGLPDWWEAYVATLYPGRDLSWDTPYPDGSGMSAGERYLRDIAKGYTETKNPSVPGYNPATLVKQTSDADGDGLPDWWENLYGLRTNSAEGDDGMNGDPDKDGLSNYAEYLIAEAYGLARLNPIQFRSDPDQLVSDYFLKVGDSYLGAFFSDHDFMEDAWEDLYGIAAVSRYIYDPLADEDDDGWSNWAECRAGSSWRRSDPSLIGRTAGDIADEKLNSRLIAEMPVPMVKVNLQYAGDQPDGTVVVKAWHDPEMNGIPDAVFTVPNTKAERTKDIGYWNPKAKDREQKVTGWLSPGGVLPNTVVFTIVDLTTADEDSRATEFAGDVAQVPNTAGTLYPMSKGERKRDLAAAGSVDYETGRFDLDLSRCVAWYVDADDRTNQNKWVFSSNSFIRVTYQARKQEGFPRTLYLSDADKPGPSGRGYLRGGTNYFQAYLAAGGGGSGDAGVSAAPEWEVGMPFGVATPFATEVGWDRQEVDIELTDRAEGQVRLAFSEFAGTGSDLPGMGEGEEGKENFAPLPDGSQGEGALGSTRVRIRRLRVNTLTNQYKSVIFDKVIRGGRGYITEADVFAGGAWALDWGFPDLPSSLQVKEAVYGVYLGDVDLDDTNTVANYTFKNEFPIGQAKAEALEPSGEYVYAARPTFKWKMPAGYPAFVLQIRQASGSRLLYDSGVRQAPRRTVDGVSVWKAPISVGGRLSPRTVYKWRVAALNAAHSEPGSVNAWSEWKVFRQDSAEPLSGGGHGSIRARVKYFGPVAPASGNVIVEAYRNGAFAGEPEARIFLGAAETSMMTSLTAKEVNAQLNGLKPGEPCYVMAYIDQNGNAARDPWESWGYANHYGETDKPYDPKPVDVENVPAIPVVDITIEDADTDQDWYPDAWEYARNPGNGDFLAMTQPNESDIEDSEFNPGLTTGTITRPRLAAMSVLLNMNLASAPEGATPAACQPETPATLTITGLKFDENGVPSVTVKAEKPVGNGAMALLSEGDPSPRVVLEYKEKLSDKEWTRISDTASIPGLGMVSGSKTNGVDRPASGFFRVRTLGPDEK